MDYPKLSYASFTENLLTKRGSINKNHPPKDMKMRLRLDLNAVELKRDIWEGETVFVSLNKVSTFTLEEPEPSQGNELKKKK
jgi:hypothetical protein